ncbi:hypothetical protein RBH29_17350 [Herbivorax sp. ANBcel31]|uniref:hypothetical protein n=1 Tax=Herbivorax sp. ANBcel31 TaxID=3069754 RepID=UPI0027B3F052|nr:hypothetical protein [Herbivorax sp. ANBcel31]MDQ2088192.1 hypothetical protein [Herbivorax sp. ANBcel31]
MNKEQLLSQLTRLYDSYGVDKSEILEHTVEDIAKGAKGYLAKLDKEKCKEYSKEDRKVLKDIYFYFC